MTWVARSGALPSGVCQLSYLLFIMAFPRLDGGPGAPADDRLEQSRQVGRAQGRRAPTQPVSIDKRGVETKVASVHEFTRPARTHHENPCWADILDALRGTSPGDRRVHHLEPNADRIQYRG